MSGDTLPPPATAKAAMNSCRSSRPSQWLPCTKQPEVSWFSSSGPASEGQAKKARAAATAAGVTTVATASPGAAQGTPLAAALSGEPGDHEAAMPRAGK